MNMHQFHAAHLTRLWQRLIPKSAVQVEMKDTFVRYLHPTKGWRYVSKRRLGLA